MRSLFTEKDIPFGTTPVQNLTPISNFVAHPWTYNTIPCRFLNHFFDELDYAPVQQFCEVHVSVFGQGGTEGDHSSFEQSARGRGGVFHTRGVLGICPTVMTLVPPEPELADTPFSLLIPWSDPAPETHSLMDNFQEGQ